MIEDRKDWTAAQHRAATPAIDWYRCAHCRLMTTEFESLYHLEEPCVPALDHDWRRLADRRETIEECAKICDEEGNTYDGDAAQAAAERIRRLP